MSDIELVKDYIVSRIELLKKESLRWKENGNTDMYNQKITRISELRILLENISDLEE